MNIFMQSISQVFKGAVKAFQTFPAAIISAVAFSIVTMIRIQLDWPEQEAYNFLFNCLHWSFALGAVFSLTVITAAKSRYDSAGSFKIANLLGVVAIALTFLTLYFFGGMDPDTDTSRYAIVSGLAAARVSAAMLISFLAFIILAGHPKDQSDFARSFFMSHKAFFIALIYGVVIMSGSSGVAGAVQALLYHDMSSKVYMYIGTVSGFLAFTIFLGYFPDFRKGQTDEHREIAQKQPRFIEILFGYIMIPLVLALTAVLLIWSGRTIVTGAWPTFVQLASIASTYTIGGIWLHMMVTHHETGMAKFYRRIYPIAALIILAFEAWALFVQLGKSGLKMDEYTFMLIWIIAFSAAVLLIILKMKAHLPIVLLTCAMTLFAVLPAVGYHALPVSAQTDRLENLLVSQGMLEDGKLVPAAAEPELTVRESITDSVSYLANSRDAKLPPWFDRNLRQSDIFKFKMGFEQVWPKQEDVFYGGSDYLSTSIYLPAGALDISDYRWRANLMSDFSKGNDAITIVGTNGTYRVYWLIHEPDGIPTLKITQNEIKILEKDLNAYVDRISAAYPPGRQNPQQGSIEDMSLKFETPEVSVMLVFNNIDINSDPQADVINYWFNLDGLYMNEKM